MKVLVIGGTLFIGRALVEELVKSGHEVAVLHRKPKHDFGRRVENIQADRNDAAAMREALSTRRFEAVFDNVYDWERGTTAEQVEATVRACGDRLSRYIFLSSVAAYGDGLNHKESDPLAPDYHAIPTSATRRPRSGCCSACTRRAGCRWSRSGRRSCTGRAIRSTASNFSGTGCARAGRSSFRATATG